MRLRLVPSAHNSERNANLILLHERRNKCVQWAFVSRERVRRSWIEVEERAPIMQNKSCAVRDQSRAKFRVVRFDKGDHVAFAIHHAQVGCVARIGHRSARRNIAVRVIHIDQFGALGSVLLGEHPADRHFRNFRIANVTKHVGVRELFSFDLNVQRARSIQSKLFQVELLHDIEHFERADALHVRRQLVNRPAAVRRGNRIHPFARIVGKILRGERAAVLRGQRQQALGNFSAIKSVAASLRDLSQRPGEIGIAKDLAHARRPVGNQKCLRGGFIIPQ